MKLVEMKPILVILGEGVDAINNILHVRWGGYSTDMPCDGFPLL
jgi:hypothetical protein